MLASKILHRGIIIRTRLPRRDDQMGWRLERRLFFWILVLVALEQLLTGPRLLLTLGSAP
ncbi:uncharacterized protein DNG_05771 [Cephalotrichum gorgonifer]|uniref:Uncharacterized protein n=1 Tax=Cephalotrichum gorgonifer TaxID=2041049 RepID=A0AAE8SW06_9PEZI|nr:uncharacterized protein DNG_05771 [Cephalotrichum gorgonifer]